MLIEGTQIKAVITQETVDMTHSINHLLHIDYLGLYDSLEVRTDIDESLRDRVYRHLLIEYRKKFGEESPMLRSIDKATSIGLIERALRTQTAIHLPLAVPTVSPDFYRMAKD